MKDMSTKTAWDTVRVCWIHMYQGLPDYFVYDAGKIFSSVEFRQHARLTGTEVKEVPVIAYDSVGKVERYYSPLRCSYEIFRDNLQDENLEKEIILQMAVKAVNEKTKLRLEYHFSITTSQLSKPKEKHLNLGSGPLNLSSQPRQKYLAIMNIILDNIQISKPNK